jgi:tetratricopeptide (TPR) repeat protein
LCQSELQAGRAVRALGILSAMRTQGHVSQAASALEALALASLGRDQEALDHVRREPNMDADDGATVARGFCTVGSRLLDNGRIEQAAGISRLLTSWRPDSTHSNLLRARLAVASGRDKEAIASYEQVVEADPNLATALKEMVQILIRSGCVEKAVSRARELVRLRPMFAPDSHRLLARALAAAGRSSESEAAARWADHHEAYLRELTSPPANPAPADQTRDSPNADPKTSPPGFLRRGIIRTTAILVCAGMVWVALSQ